MLLKELSIPLDDLRLRTPDNGYNQLISPMACDGNSSSSQRMRGENEEKKDATSEVSKEEESEEEQYEVTQVKSIKRLVKIISSDSEDDADKSNSKVNVDSLFTLKKIYKTVNKPKEIYPRRSSRQRNIKKMMKEESSDSDESPSSEEDNENKDPDFDQKEEEEIKQKKGMKKKDIKVERSSLEPLFVKKEPLSPYELMIQKNREEKMAFLQSLKIDEAKAGLSEIVESATKKKVQPVKRKFKKVEKPTSPPVLRKSRRLANVSMNLSEDSLYYNSLKSAADAAQEKPEKVIPPEMTFKEALESEDFYESYKVDVNIKETKPEAKFTIYDKSVLGKMTVSESNIAKVTPARITALTWHPSPEHMIIAAGDKYGQLGIWNVESENPYVFKTHLEGITNLQFNPYNQNQLISSSYDGILRCGDMVQHNFSELYNISDETCCTYFDILSATTYLVAQKNGQVALVDKRTRSKSCEKKHECHDYSIKTVNIHPTNKNFFVTAENKGSIRLWDLRKLQSTPVADITHHKRCVHSAFFSPVTGNSILALSTDDSISIFDSTNLTSDIKVRVQMKHNNCTGRWLSIFRATWLPNSEEAFMVGSMLEPRRIEVYDKNMFVYSLMMHENLTTITSTNAFHPTRPALAGANSSGKVIVFT